MNRQDSVAFVKLAREKILKLYFLDLLANGLKLFLELLVK
jgi:hypothetical protein